MTKRIILLLFYIATINCNSQEINVGIHGGLIPLEKNLNVNSIGINAVATVGYGDIAFYARQSITPLFKDNQGPKMYPTSFGIILFW